MTPSAPTTTALFCIFVPERVVGSRLRLYPRRVVVTATSGSNDRRFDTFHALIQFYYA